MRAKTSLQAKTWFPKGAERNNQKGVALLDPSKPPLPRLLDHSPQLAEFVVPFKREDDVFRTILEMREKHPDHMTQEQHVEWAGFIQKRPHNVRDVAPSDLPTQTLHARPADAEAGGGPTALRTRPTDRSALDVAEDPIVSSLTHAGFTPAEKKRLLGEHTSGWQREDATGCDFEVGQYCFVMSEECITDYRLPWDLVCVNSVSADKQTAKVTYQQEFGGYAGEFRAWLPAGVVGNAYYRGTVGRDSVRVFNVTRLGKAVTKPYKLTSDIKKKLQGVPEGT
jgi:hypothetical protein